MEMCAKQGWPVLSCEAWGKQGQVLLVIVLLWHPEPILVKCLRSTPKKTSSTVVQNPSGPDLNLN